MTEMFDFESLRVTLASPEDIKGWSHGEVTKPETINYRTLKPEKDGLFSENIFGPTKDWECYCGKYKRIRYRGVVCDKCGVEVAQAKVRRERMGHITLAAPVAHSWFFKGAPNKLSLLLDISPRQLDAIIYFAQYAVTSIDKEAREQTLKKLQEVLATRIEGLKGQLEGAIAAAQKESAEAIAGLKREVKHKDELHLKTEEMRLKTRQKIQSLRDTETVEQSTLEEIYKTVSQMVRNVAHGDLLTEEEYSKLVEYGAADFFTAKMGAEALLEILESLDLNKLAANLREEVDKTSGQRHLKAAKRLRLVEGMRKASISSSWMILRILPVLPPELRPMVQLSGGRFATSDLNDLYRRVINRNNRLKRLIDLGAPEIILRNEKRMLQEAVDTLVDSRQRSGARPIANQLRSLSDMLRGKQGRFRQNLLGKRVDYSGRSVIVVGPELSLSEAGLPKEMALEMFKPFVLRELIAQGYAPNVKSAKHVLEHRSPEVWDILEEITTQHPILLNRAPTLHKLGIQAFYPVLIDGNAIRIHPCVCAGYNADFDGDQMAVHVPLSGPARQESTERMLSTHNLLRPADGSPITIPNKEMALGCFYLTTVDGRIQAHREPLSDPPHAIFAYQFGTIGLRQLITVRIDGSYKETTVGRIFFNEKVPEALRFVNEPVKAATIKSLMTRALNVCTPTEVIDLIDGLKVLGFQAATEAGLSVALFDVKILPEKDKIIAQAEERVSAIERNLRRGLITKEEQRRLANEVWIATTDQLADSTWKHFEEHNSVRIIIDSGGARATGDQIKQLAGMRGLVSDPTGRIVELPTKSNYREGLSVFEYFTSSRGARKGLADKALKTAEAGYLTRRLVDVAHDVIIRIEDCETQEGITITKEDTRAVPFYVRTLGRVVLKRVVDPKSRKVLLKENQEIDEEVTEALERAGIVSVTVRSPLTCQARYGLCAACYGRDLSTKRRVELGTPVGVIAAQSIGEPGTQLTMRTFHLGGIVGLDITQGLPRVEELFEARIPKVFAPVSEISGRVRVEEGPEGWQVTVKSVGIKPPAERTYIIPATLELTVANGDLVSPGTALAAGPLDVKELLRIQGLRAAQRYIVDGAQEVYESQGVTISDKHFEVIVRKMCDKVRVTTAGDTALLPGELVDRVRFDEENGKILAAGGEPATAEVTVLGVTRAALYTQSFLSAASFQETTNVLTEAAVLGKVDRLLGLKENVIIGRLIPVTPERAAMTE